MTTEKTNSELKEYAGGWIMERKGTPIPTFLKIASPLIALAAIIYLFVNINGEIHQATRGPLVQQLNAVTGSANGFMYIVAGLIAVYLVILATFLFKNSKHED